MTEQTTMADVRAVIAAVETIHGSPTLGDVVAGRVLAALRDAGLVILARAQVEWSAEREALLSVVEQFAYPDVDREGRPVLGTGGLRSLEEAFAALGWDDPHVVDREVE